MKNLVITLLLTTSFHALATDLACFTKKPLKTGSGKVSAMVLRNIESDELEATLPDQNTLSPFAVTEGGKTVEATFSNECDNAYTVTFPAEDFQKLMADEDSLDELSGTAHYGDSGGASSTTGLTCRPL